MGLSRRLEQAADQGVSVGEGIGGIDEKISYGEPLRGRQVIG